MERIYAGPVRVKVRVITVDEFADGTPVEYEPHVKQYATAGERMLALDVRISKTGRKIL